MTQRNERHTRRDGEAVFPYRQTAVSQMKNPGFLSSHTGRSFSSSSSSGTTRSLLGTGARSCVNLGTLFFSPFTVPFVDRCSEARWAGDDAGPAFRAVDGVEGEDFWKNPRIDFWLFMFCALEVERFSTPDGGVAALGDDAAGAPLAMLRDGMVWLERALEHTKRARFVCDWVRGGGQCGGGRWDGEHEGVQGGKVMDHFEGRASTR